jgi:hypothetical protein
MTMMRMKRKVNRKRHPPIPKMALMGAVGSGEERGITRIRLMLGMILKQAPSKAGSRRRGTRWIVGGLGSVIESQARG